MKWQKPVLLDIELQKAIYISLMRNGKTDEAMRLNNWIFYQEIKDFALSYIELFDKRL